VIVAAVIPLGGLYVERRLVGDATPVRPADPTEATPAT